MDYIEVKEGIYIITLRLHVLLDPSFVTLSRFEKGSSLVHCRCRQYQVSADCLRPITRIVNDYSTGTLLCQDLRSHKWSANQPGISQLTSEDLRSVK